MATLIGTGTAFYSVHENWSVIDALFFSVTTLTTTGYGNLVPETDLGKVFTMLYVLLGAGDHRRLLQPGDHRPEDGP